MCRSPQTDTLTPHSTSILSYIYKESDITPVRGEMCGMVEGEVRSSLLFIQAGNRVILFGAYISNTRHVSTFRRQLRRKSIWRPLLTNAKILNN